MRASLIIAAGGSGERFRRSLRNGTGSSPSKLFFPLAGKPLIAHTLSPFQNFSAICETVIAAPRPLVPTLRRLARRFGWKRLKCVAGGRTRAESVWKALQHTNSRNPWIFVHDGARPFVSVEALKKMERKAKSGTAVILGKKVVPTIKELNEKGGVRRTVDRSNLLEAETPQVIERKRLEEAFRNRPSCFGATDEASLAELLGIPVTVVIHDDWNPKITTFRDLEFAESFLERKQKQQVPGTLPCLPAGRYLVPTGYAGFRVGFGRDIHRLAPGRKFYLGGVRIPFSRGPLGHSDGDALLHAVADAMLGAAGAGDIGDWFSDKSPKTKNMRSAKIIAAVLKEISKRGWKIEQVDTVIQLEKPRLGPLKQKIRNRLARLLGIKPDAVSIKAKTAEGFGAVGRGEAISCEALVNLRRVIS